MDRPKLSISFLRKGETNAPGAAIDNSKGSTARQADSSVSPFEKDETPKTVLNEKNRSEPLPGAQVEQALRKKGKEDGVRIEEEEAWLQIGLVVRVQETTLLDGLYNGMTGIVKAVVGPDGYGADVQVANGDVLRLDQDDLQTILPSPGEFGLIIRGTYRDTKVKIISLGKDDIEVELEEGRRAGHRLLLPTSHVSRHIAIK